MDLISVINRPGSKAFGLVRRKVVFDGVLILLLLPPPHASYLMILHNIETIPTLCTLQYVMAARVMHFPSALVFLCDAENIKQGRMPIRLLNSTQPLGFVSLDLLTIPQS